MVAAHHAVALAAIVIPAAGVFLGFVAYRRGRQPGPMLRQLLALSQTVLIAQVALGLLLLSDGRRAPDDLHYLYGFLALGAALSPWLYAPAEPRRRLAWFLGATLLAAALAVRAYTTS